MRARVRLQSTFLLMVAVVYHDEPYGPIQHYKVIHCNAMQCNLIQCNAIESKAKQSKAK